MRDAIDSGLNAEAVADRLVALALDHGGRDNVTVIVVDVHPSSVGPAVR